MIPKYLHKYFWDTNPDKVDVQKDSQDIIFRILNEGDIPAIKWLFKTFSINAIKESLSERRGFSPRSVNSWSIFLNIPKNQILCLSKSYRKGQNIKYIKPKILKSLPFGFMVCCIFLFNNQNVKNYSAN